MVTWLTLGNNENSHVCPQEFKYQKNENSTEEIRKKLEAGKLIILWLVGYYKNLLLRGERRESWKYVNCL